MVQVHLSTQIFWYCVYNEWFLPISEENPVKLRKKPKKEQLSFLIDKNYVFYKFWYPFYARKLYKRKLSETAVFFTNPNRSKAYSIGMAITHLKNNFYEKISKNYLQVHRTIRFDSLITYYMFYMSFYKNQYTHTNLTEYDQFLIILLDIRFKKPRLFAMQNDSCVLSVSSGIILKSLGLEEKNLKKHQRILNVMIKSSINKLNDLYYSYSFVIQIKGTKFFLYKITSLLKNFIDVNKLIILYTPMISRNKIRFKKIKSIKRNLKKRYLNI